MTRVLTLALVASAATGGYLTALLANPPVELQPATPGVAQTGNVNISGKVLSGSVSATDAGVSAQVVVGNATNTTGANYGGLFKTSSSLGTGVRGVANAATGTAVGGTFQSSAPGGSGAMGFATSPSGVNFGLYGKAVSPAGFAVFGQGNAAFTGNLGIGTGTSTITHRLEAVANDTAGTGVVSVLNGTTPFTPVESRTGLIAAAIGNGGTFNKGLYGAAISSSGLNCYGVQGHAGGTGLNYGVLGSASNGPSDYAGYFSGALYATSANSAIKAFMIDHPLDPENKVLTHSSVESDQRMNLYRGEVRTDANGFAIVTVPSWFDAVNTDIQYQLTVVDESNSSSFVQAKIVQRIKNGKFKIRTSAGGTAVNWLVTGKRNDPTSNHYPLEVERLKTEGERGKYYEPEAFGKDPSLGMGYMPMKTEEQAPPKK